VAARGHAAQEQLGSMEGWRARVREVLAVGLSLAGALLGLAIFSYAPDARDNIVGPVGAVLADILLQSLGFASLLVPVGLFAYGVAMFLGARPQPGTGRVAAASCALLGTAVLAHLAAGSWRGMEAGGVLGGFLAAVLYDTVGGVGAWVLALAGLLLSASFAGGQSLLGLAEAGGRGTAGAFQFGRTRLQDWLDRDRGGDVEPIVLGRDHIVERPGPRIERAEKSDRGEREKKERSTPIVTTPTPAPREKKARQVELGFADGTSYCLPELSLLDPPVENEVGVDHATLIASSRVLETKLQTFDVFGEVRGIHPGPVITTYEFEPAEGIKVNRIVSLADDLAMAMRAMSVRILAPIPGKSVVGIEVSNARREKVTLREVICSDAFQQSTSALALALGKDTTGSPAVGDLARMPHLLVAGATGAGKSVFLNCLLVSILMRSSPRDVRLVLVDPKMLELATYEEIPHLLVPVITEAKPAVTVLENLVREMNERYRLLKDKGVRSIDAYNRSIAEDAKEGRVIELEEGAEEGEAAGTPPMHQHLPRIVVIIDELADLMMTRRDCEEPITRLAQKARAAGIHLVIATQRPSVDVITGLIKANFPARISFQVAGKVDSRTILDTMGAERLLGNGDMLFLPPQTSRLQRLHGAYVSDEEIKNVADFVREQQNPEYRMELFEDEDAEEAGESAERGEESYDEMYDEAVRVVTETGKASISYVQRRLQVGYNRAARMIECMEREGVVSSPDHRGAREVLARAGYEE